jgi:hypothetical protein
LWYRQERADVFFHDHSGEEALLAFSGTREEAAYIEVMNVLMVVGICNVL